MGTLWRILWLHPAGELLFGRCCIRRELIKRRPSHVAQACFHITLRFRAWLSLLSLRVIHAVLLESEDDLLMSVSAGVLLLQPVPKTAGTKAKGLQLHQVFQWTALPLSEFEFSRREEGGWRREESDPSESIDDSPFATVLCGAFFIVYNKAIHAGKLSLFFFQSLSLSLRASSETYHDLARPLRSDRTLCLPSFMTRSLIVLRQPDSHFYPLSTPLRIGPRLRASDPARRRFSERETVLEVASVRRIHSSSPHRRSSFELITRDYELQNVGLHHSHSPSRHSAPRD
jgi:hypothetical protein